MNSKKTCLFQKKINETNDKLTIVFKEEEMEQSYTYNLIDNICYPMFCDNKRWEFLNKNIKYNESDIIIATYPKSGTTWLEQIVILMKYGIKNKDKLNPSIRNSYDFENNIGKIHIEGSIEQPNNQLYESQEMKYISMKDFENIPLRIIKTHAPFNLVIAKDQLFKNKNKIIVVSRNPLDATVSGYFHYNTLRRFYKTNTDPSSSYKNISFQNWASLWVKGNVSFGSWFDWNQEWLNIYENNKSHVFFVTYEELKRNPLNEIKRLNVFLEMNLSDEELIEIVELSSFSKMKKDAEQKFIDDVNSDIHLRKGIVGDWKNYFDEDLFIQYHNTIKKYTLLYNLYKHCFLQNNLISLENL